MTEDVDYEINYEVSKGGYLRIWATSDQLNTLVKYVTAQMQASRACPLIRQADLCLPAVTPTRILPGYSGHIQHYTDSGSSESLITEVSHEHDYILDTDGNEHWV